MSGLWRKINKNNWQTWIRAGLLIAYGEGDPPTDGYVARVSPDLTVNGLDFEFIFDQYEWVAILTEDI
jgi:hypothetical protein